MHIDVEAVSNLCFVTTKLYLVRLLRNQLVYNWPKRTLETIRGVQTAKLKVLSFAPLALVRAYMWTLYWRVRESSPKFAAGSGGTGNIMRLDCGGRGHVGVA